MLWRGKKWYKKYSDFILMVSLTETSLSTTWNCSFYCLGSSLSSMRAMLSQWKEFVSYFSKILIFYIILISVLFLAHTKPINIELTLDLDLNDIILTVTTETLNVLKRTLEMMSSLEKNKSSKPSKPSKLRKLRKLRL